MPTAVSTRGLLSVLTCSQWLRWLLLPRMQHPDSSRSLYVYIGQRCRVAHVLGPPTGRQTGTCDGLLMCLCCVIFVQVLFPCPGEADGLNKVWQLCSNSHRHVVRPAAAARQYTADEGPLGARPPAPCVCFFCPLPARHPCNQ